MVVLEKRRAERRAERRRRDETRGGEAGGTRSATFEIVARGGGTARSRAGGATNLQHEKRVGDRAGAAGGRDGLLRVAGGGRDGDVNEREWAPRGA